MERLKGVIISLRDVLAKSGKIDPNILRETVNLIKYIHSVGVQPVLVSNTLWTVGDKQQPFVDFISKLCGVSLPYYQGNVDIPYKQTAAAMQTILDKHGWTSQNTVYIGSTEFDMRAARNGGLLFLNAKWHAQNSDYGFEFSSPKDIARFIDCCCLTPKDWFWGIQHGDLQCFSIAPLGEYSKQYPQAAVYSTDAKQAVKFGVGDLRFWGLLMASRIHFSGIGAQAHYASPYPGHAIDSEKAELMSAVKIVAGSLKASYLHDLIVRHTTASKSQQLRNSGQSPSAANQLSTVHLRRDPLMTGPLQRRYKNSPIKDGKTVLIVDDICTEGFSLECARAFVEKTGAKAILLTWMKTPGPNDYHEIQSLEPVITNAYGPYIPENIQVIKHSNSQNVINANAATEIADAFSRFSNWDWPAL
jgi:hypothetical protein